MNPVQFGNNPNIIKQQALRALYNHNAQKPENQITETQEVSLTKLWDMIKEDAFKDLGISSDMELNKMIVRYRKEEELRNKGKAEYDQGMKDAGVADVSLEGRRNTVRDLSLLVEALNKLEWAGTLDGDIDGNTSIKQLETKLNNIPIMK